MVQKFVETCRRALATGQSINIDSHIPPNHRTVINFHLVSLRRPLIEDHKSVEQLFQSLFAMVGPPSAQQVTEEMRLQNFFKDVISYLGNHNYDPPHPHTMASIIQEVLRLQTVHGLTANNNIERFTEEQSVQFLQSVMAVLENRVRKNPQNKRISHLLDFLQLRQLGLEFKLEKEPKTLADFLLSLMCFGTESQHVVQLAQELTGTARKPDQSGSGSGSGKLNSGHNKHREKEPAQDASLNVIDTSPGSSRCTICNKPGHQPQSCAFNPRATPGNVHPLVEQLRGKKFSGSDVEQRLERAVVENPKKTGILHTCAFQEHPI